MITFHRFQNELNHTNSTSSWVGLEKGTQTKCGSEGKLCVCFRPGGERRRSSFVGMVELLVTTWECEVVLVYVG